MVGLAGLEPARPYGQQILSLQRLPFRHRPSPLFKRGWELYNPVILDMQSPKKIKCNYMYFFGSMMIVYALLSRAGA